MAPLYNAVMKSRDQSIFERRFIAKDQLIIHEGEVGQQAFLIQSGIVQVFTLRDGQPIELARLSAGEILGEMSLIAPLQKRSASAKSLTDCMLITISRQQFEEKLRESDPTIRAVLQMAVKRIGDANLVLSDQKSDLASLRSAAMKICENVVSGLPAAQARNFTNTVRPQLDILLDAIATFEERFGDPS